MSQAGGLSILERLTQRNLVDLLDEVCAERCVCRADVLGPVRTRWITAARHRFWELLRAKGFSLPEIGWLVMRDHTTVLHALRKLAGKGSEK